jgi:hypothetical protein
LFPSLPFFFDNDNDADRMNSRYSRRVLRTGISFRCI